MIENITPERIANAILMKHDYKGSYLIVEGERDNLFYTKFIDHDQCKIIVALGYPRVKDSIELLNSRGYSGALGIIDRDFAVILGRNLIINNLIETDYHDLEIMIIDSPAFDIIVKHFCSKEKLEKFPKRDKLREHFFDISKHLGILKLANFIYELGLVFKAENINGNALNYQDFIDKNTLEYIGDDDLISSIINYSRNRRTNLKSRDEITTRFKGLKSNSYDLKQLCNGHHITALIQFAMRKALGNSESNKITQKLIEEKLILCYDSRYFQNTNLYASIKGWEVQNSRKILSI